MGGHKTLTIGVTVNLEHYENLRVEVSGEVDSPHDAEELSGFLTTILGSFGRNDPATADRIDSYRRRVLPGYPCTVNEGVEGRAIASLQVEDTGGMTPDYPEHPESPEAELSAPAPPAAAESLPGATCALCGAPVSPAEQKMSQLFTSRTLCKSCMKNL